MSPKIERLLNTVLLWSLILWGGYSGVMFLQSHLFPIFPEHVAQNILSSSFSPFLRGLHGLIRLPLQAQGSLFITFSLGLVLMVFFLEQRNVHLPGVTLTPLRIVLAVLVLLFTTFIAVYTTPLFGQPRSLIFRPSPDVYPSATREILAVLEGNVGELRAGGCIREEVSGGPILGTYRTMCLIRSFLVRVLPPIVLLMWILLDCLLLGRFALRALRVNSFPLLDIGFAVLLGACVLVIALFGVGLAGAATAPVVAALLLFPLSLFLSERRAVRSFMRTQWRATLSLPALLTLFLAFLLSLNLLTVLRPFPIGWDDLTQYLASPRLFAERGGTVPGMDRFQWEYLASVPYILFGPESALGAQGAQAVLWSGSALAALLLVAFSRAFVSGNAGIIAALFYLTIPMVGHASFTELKTEGALFALSIGAVAALLLGLCPHSRRSLRTASGRRGFASLSWIAVAGAIAGFAFSVKFTGVLLLSLLLVLVSFHYLGLVGALAAATLPFSGFAILSGRHVGLGSDFFFLPEQWMTSGALTGLGLTLLAACTLLCGVSLVRRRKQAMSFLTTLTVFVAALLLLCAPWMLRNIWSWGDLSPVHVLEARDTFRPAIWLGDLPDTLAVNTGHPSCGGTATEESFARYRWPGGGVGAVLAAPWHLVMNTFTRGFYVTLTPLLLLLPLLLLFARFWHERWLQGLMLGMVVIIVAWFLVGRGVPWYGALILFPAALLVDMLCRHRERVVRAVACILTAVALVSALAMRAAQFSMRSEAYEYALGKVSKAAAQELTFPGFALVAGRVRQLAEERPERPLLYRIGTTLPYFLGRYAGVIGRTDNRLDFFACLNQEGNHELTLKRLQALGFSSIIFDTTAADIEPDSAGTLHGKVIAFKQFLYDPALRIERAVDRPDWGYVFAILP